MIDKELLDLLGLDNKSISLTIDDEYTQHILEKRIDNYLKKIDEENKKEKLVDDLKKSHEKYLKKQDYLDMFNDSFVYKKIRDRLIRDGFIYRCPFCLDVSNQYGKPIECYNKNKKR